MAYIDGTSTKRHEEDGKSYVEYRLMSDDGHFICAFYGPVSLSAAGTVCKHFNDHQKIMSPSAAMEFMKKD